MTGNLQGRWIAAVLAGALLAGCVGTAPSRYYLLASIPDTGSAKVSSARAIGPRVGVGPITVPQHLDRPNIVTRVTPTRIELAQFDSWAEPLKDNITRILAENLAVLVPTHQIATYPFTSSTATDYQVTVNLHRLDGDATGRVTLIAYWNLLGRGGRELIEAHRFEQSARVPPGDTAQLVAAESDLVAALSRESLPGYPEPPPEQADPRPATRWLGDGWVFEIA